MDTYTKPYLWYMPERFPGNGCLLFDNFSRNTNSYIFMHGHLLPYDTGNPNLKATLQDPRDYDLIYTYKHPLGKLLAWDCVPNTGQAPIVNGHVLRLLKDLCPHDLQAFPVVIRNENPKNPDFENRDYWLINITNTVDAIDKDKTQFSYLSPDLGGHVYGIEKHLNLNKDCMEKHCISRDSTLRSEILVSPDLVALFKKHKVTGVRFLKDFEAYP